MNFLEEGIQEMERTATRRYAKRVPPGVPPLGATEERAPEESIDRNGS